MLPGLAEYEPELVEAAKRYVVTGSTVCKDQERVEAITADVLAGLSHTAICRKHRCAWQTVDAVMKHAEDVGKLTGLKDRLLRATSAASLMAWDQVNETLAHGLEPAQGTSILAGIATDKCVTLSGWQPTAQIAVNIGVAVQVNVNDELAAIRQLAGTTASQAAVDVAQVADAVGFPCLPAPADTAGDTAETLMAAELAPLAAREMPPGPDGGGPRGGGGGVPAREGGSDDVGSVRGDLATNGINHEL